MYAIITQLCVRGKICPYQRHTKKGGLYTCFYGVLVSIFYAYFILLLLKILIFSVFLIFNSEM
jgi:uncharacterized metal-binding protein